jgi:hypothetical protein
MKLVAALTYFFALMAFSVIAIYGYVVNLVTLALHFDGMTVVELGVRLVGAIVAPLGALMGLFA